MASQFDLAPRLAALQASGLAVESDYKGHPSAWMLTALKDTDVRVVNVKGIKTDDTVCMVRLVFLENLLATIEGSLAVKESA